MNAYVIQEAQVSPDDGARARKRGRGRHGRGQGMSGFFGGRGPRAGRGDIRAAILALLTEQPMHGYQIMNELAERTGGVWRPSPGSIYPSLQMLQDEGLVKSVDQDGRRVFELTEAGHGGRRAGELRAGSVGRSRR